MLGIFFATWSNCEIPSLRMLQTPAAPKFKSLVKQTRSSLFLRQKMSKRIYHFEKNVFMWTNRNTNLTWGNKRLPHSLNWTNFDYCAETHIALGTMKKHKMNEFTKNWIFVLNRLMVDSCLCMYWTTHLFLWFWHLGIKQSDPLKKKKEDIFTLWRRGLTSLWAASLRRQLTEPYTPSFT